MSAIWLVKSQCTEYMMSCPSIGTKLSPILDIDETFYAKVAYAVLYLDVPNSGVEVRLREAASFPPFNPKWGGCHFNLPMSDGW